MRANEIAALADRSGHAVGAHTARHVMLPRQSRAVQRDEIESSRRALEVLVDRPVRAFAYPFGAYDDQVVAEVRAASFDVALTCDATPIVGGVDALRVPRLEVTPQHAANFDEWLAAKFRNAVTNV